MLFLFVNSHLQACFTILLIFVFLSLFQCFYIQNNNASKLPPGSRGLLPFVGETLPFITSHLSSSTGHFLANKIKRYGKIFRSHLFGRPTIVSCDSEFNSFILQNEDRLFVSSYPKNIPGVLGDHTLLSVTGDVHKRLRGVALSVFAVMKTPGGSFISDIEFSALRVMESWKNKEKLVICTETRKFTFNVIVKQILSLMPEDPESVQILDNFKTFMRGLASVPINLPMTPYAKAIQAKHRIYEIVGKIIKRRRENEENDRGTMDFLDVLLVQTDQLSEAEILSLILDLLLGGYETTAMLIAIIVKFIGRDQKILHDLWDEHASIMRSKEQGEGLGWDDYKKMKFTQCVVNEALRLGNVVKFVHRKAIKPIQYRGYEIPAGWKVLPVFSGVHLDPALHSDPLCFSPWRWQRDESGSMKNFMPFSGGKRLCPGSDLARLETAVFLHHLVLKFRWTALMEEDWPMSFPYLDFKNGLQVAIQPLNPSTNLNIMEPMETI